MTQTLQPSNFRNFDQRSYIPLAGGYSDPCGASCPDLPKVDFAVCVRPFTPHP